MGAVILPIVGLLIMIILIVMFFSKKSILSYETKIYKLFLLAATVFIIVGLLTFFVAKMTNDFFLIKIFQKIYMSILVILNYLSVKYCIFLFHDNKELRLLKFFIAIFSVIFIVLILILPLNVVFYDDILDGNGWSYNVALIDTIISFVFFIVITVYLIYTKISLKKIIPFIVLILLYILSFILRIHFKELIFEGFFYSYILLIMYFTIENPDMKLLEEVHRAKEISDNANEEKTLFLYNMTQEIRNTTNEINDNASLILDSNSIDDDKDLARNIITTTSKFTTMTNEILDISKMDLANVKVYNTKYNIKILIKQLVSIYTDMCKDKELKFRTNIDHDIPELLYGDLIELKEVLTIILNNSIKYTNSGYVEFDVSTIIKNDICRLIITIEDSGIGIKSEDIKKIKIDNKSLSKANKLVTLMNGTMLISSNYGMGTKVKIIIDQKIGEVVDSEISKYEETFNSKNILMVDDSEAGIKIVEKVLKGINIKIDYANNGRECLNKIKINKYDLILLDEELSQISGIELMKKIKEIRNFNIPVILLTKDNNYEYNGDYLSAGFKDYILKPVKKDVLLEKINKYGLNKI